MLEVLKMYWLEFELILIVVCLAQVYLSATNLITILYFDLYIAVADASKCYECTGTVPCAGDISTMSTVDCNSECRVNKTSEHPIQLLVKANYTK